MTRNPGSTIWCFPFPLDNLVRRLKPRSRSGEPTRQGYAPLTENAQPAESADPKDSLHSEGGFHSVNFLVKSGGD